MDEKEARRFEMASGEAGLRRTSLADLFLPRRVSTGKSEGLEGGEGVPGCGEDDDIGTMGAGADSGEWPDI